jgi:predicted ATPase/class 3 adenylate cyclase
MPDLPAGTVTFLFTDIEGSTGLLRRLGDTDYRQLHADHHDLVRKSIAAHNGSEVDAQSESFFVSFPTARGAVNCAIAIQRAVSAHAWPDGTIVRVRIGVHTGEAIETPTGYVGVDVHRAARLCGSGYGGQILLSQTTYSLVRHDLTREVTVRDLGEHRLKDLQHPERIFQVVLPELPSEFPPLRSLSAVPNNLPLQLTSFIGREREIAEIKRILDDSRLLTLTGPGGCGKTRLALQAAAEMLDQFPNGIWLVELSALADPGLVAGAVAKDLGLRQEPSDMTGALADYLRGRRAMIILDGCEHLLAGCARLAEALLTRITELRILATSRQGLGIRGEMNYVIPSLSLPEDGHVRTLDQLQGSEAAHLFLERVLMSRPDFVPTDALAPAIAQVVKRLDGIPLAIELAAARVKVLSVDQIARRLDDRFRLLTGGSRTLARQKTLESAIDWSYDLLSEEEKTLFRRLSVFAGRFSLKGAEIVCAGGRIRTADVIDWLSLLIDKSLVQAEEQEGEMRYRLLETVREYSRAKLAASGESEALRDAHLAFFLSVAEEAEPRLRSVHGQVWLERLDVEHDDLRAAMAWAISVPRRTDELLRLASALWYFWYERGHLTEGRDWLDKAVSAHAGAPTVAYARALGASAYLAWRQGDLARAAALSQSGRDFSQALNDRWALALSLLDLGLLARRQDDYPRAAALHEESLALFRDSGDSWGIGESLRLLGIALWLQADYDRARAVIQEGLQLYQSLGDQRGIVDSLHILGRTTAYSGDVEAGRPLLEESLELYRRMNRPSGLAQTLYVLARVELQGGEHERAKTLLEESLAVFRHIRDDLTISNVLTLMGKVDTRLRDEAAAARHFGESLTIRGRLGYQWDKWGIAEYLESVAGLAVARRNYGSAAKLLGQAASIRSVIRAPLPPIDRGQYERDLQEIRSAIGEQAARQAWTQGEGLSTEQALAFSSTVLALRTS